MKKLIVNSTQDDELHTFGIDFYIPLDTPCKACLVSVGHLNILDFTVNFTHSRSRALAVQLAINVLNRVIKCVNYLSLVMKYLHYYWSLVKCAPYALCYSNLAMIYNVIDILWSLTEVHKLQPHYGWQYCHALWMIMLIVFLVKCMFDNYMHFAF